MILRVRARRLPLEVTARLCEKQEKILTPEGVMIANPGDWVVTGIKGESYPVKPDIFAESFTIITAEVASKRHPKPADNSHNLTYFEATHVWTGRCPVGVVEIILSENTLKFSSKCPNCQAELGLDERASS